MKDIPNKTNPKKEIALLQLGEAISSYQPKPEYDPAPYCRSDTVKDFSESLRDIRRQLVKVRKYIHLQSSYEPLRLFLTQMGIDPVKINDPQYFPDSYIFAIALAAWSDLISTSEGTCTERFINLLAPLVSEDWGTYVEGKLATRLVVAKLMEKGLLTVNEQCIHLPYKIRKWLMPHELSRPNLDENIVKHHLAAISKARRDAQAKLLPNTPAPLNSPHAIYMRLKEYVIGNDFACRQLSVRGYLHLQRRELLKAKQPAGSNECILVMGESGTGKTYMVENFCRLSGLPFASLSASQFTSTGYVGMDCDDALKTLIRNAGDPKQQATIERSRFGVVLLDEWDKRRSHSDTGLDVSGSSVQYEFLRMMSGTKVQLGTKRNENVDYPVEFDTNGTFFCFSGAFTNIGGIVKRLIKDSTGIGFTGETSLKQSPRIYDALLEYGMVAEFLNRITAVITMTAPDRNTLVKIATSSHGDIQTYNRILTKQGMNLSIDDKGLLAMAEFCIDTKLYSRGVKLIVSSLAEEAVFNQITGNVVFGKQEVSQAIIRASTV
jgi:ATP-dependent Clp protease ATP-binding subunit ClpX